MATPHKRWCAQCSHEIAVFDAFDSPPPCKVCGHRFFLMQPVNHSSYQKELVLVAWFNTRVFEHDNDFLRSCGIQP